MTVSPARGGTPPPLPPLPVPHRSWCQDAGNVFTHTDHSIVIARCRSCRAEYLAYPDDDDEDTA